MKRKVILVCFFSALLALIAAGFLLPALARRSNCGGNSAALAACKGYVTVLQLWAAGNDNKSFDFSSADVETQRRCLKLPGASWIRSARLLAKIQNVKIDPAAEKQVILVCDQPFNNVPQKFWGKAPFSHAVAYSTGESALISPEEFSRLNLSGFVDLQALGKSRRN
jgi:hypothetical protein